MRKSELVSKLFHNLGGAALLNVYWGKARLTVLAYHRIINSATPDFNFYAPNVSATPELFARQMAYVAKNFNVIDLKTLVDALDSKKTLPPRPLLITFDDGYLDNYQNAFPILKAHGFPAVIFLMTSRMTSQKRAWWDETAYYFHHTKVSQADLPMIGAQPLATPQDRFHGREAFIRELKLVPEAEKLTHIAALSNLLEVAPPQDGQIFVTWDQVRELVKNGVACQPHTVNHPILTRIDEKTMVDELAGSKEAILKETDQEILAFAYPNGRLIDYSPAVMNTLHELGYRVAFTLTPGPDPDFKKHPFEIPRIYIGQWDNFDSFVTKIMGLLALVDGQKYYE